ncbi:response regulator [Cohnella thermotolerans]|uniref:response regulator n=1 Tax=Cohnella thermotolerans TaxID=329858 RepID=UPI000423A3D0|nr:response regulator [Cohnella thermotolerans]
MNMLIVDDEIHALEGLKHALDWEALGIASVLTANNIRQAKEVLRSHSVDIMICDIEMPEGSGLELLAWVKESRREVESIILTCHAEFTYAKRAIQLGGLEYLLKPVPHDELSEAVEKAKRLVLDRRDRENRHKNSEYWERHKPLVMERFWHDVLHRVIPPDRHAIEEAAASRNIELAQESEYLPVLIDLERMPEGESAGRSLKEAASAYVSKRFAEAFSVAVDAGTLFVAIPQRPDAPYDLDAIRSCCRGFIAFCRETYGWELSCYVDFPVPVTGLPESFERLKHGMQANVAIRSRVFMPGETPASKRNVPLPDDRLWKVMLQEGKMTLLVQDAEHFLERLVEEQALDADMLHRFYHHFLQVLYFYLNENGIHAAELYQDSTSLELAARSTASLEDMRVWLRHVTERAEAHLNVEQKPEMVIDRIKNYIRNHLDKELTRQEIAQHVFLNPDYISRLFRKKTGLSLTEYTTQLRVEIAKELLAKTDLAVQAIAARVGYTNFSYFSKMFKAAAGMNPVDYRRSLNDLSGRRSD